MSAMQYKGYTGSVEFSEKDALFYGKVQGVNALVSYEGKNAAELQADFHDAVDDYISIAAKTHSASIIEAEREACGAQVCFA